MLDVSAEHARRMARSLPCRCKEARRVMKRQGVLRQTGDESDRTGKDERGAAHRVVARAVAFGREQVLAFWRRVGIVSLLSVGGLRPSLFPSKAVP